jgi:hypothetical protein
MGFFKIKVFGCNVVTAPGVFYTAVPGAVYKTRITNQSERTNQELQPNLFQQTGKKQNRVE